MPLTRRSLLISALTIFVLLVVATPASARRRAVGPPMNLLYTEGGYASATSVVQGGSIRFHIATSISPFNVEIVNLADNTTVLRQMVGLESRPQNCTWAQSVGCDWDVTGTLAVGHDWPSGYYAARFPTRFGTRNIIFVVRAANPGFSSRMLIVSPTNTYQAYNSFGNKSFYPSNSPDRAHRVSYDRPYHEDNGLGRFDFWERRFVDWLEANDRSYEVATDIDLEDPTLLGRYNAVVIVGHSEYWTSNARRNLEAYSRNGGHVAVLGGNTMWWQARLENNNRDLISYKDVNLDPALSTDPSSVTGHWFEPPLNNPENFILGTSFRHGGYANTVNGSEDVTLLPVEQRVGYTVVDPTHWIFEGANVAAGTTFGRESLGAEVDGVLFNCDADGKILGPDGSDGAPLNYHILAVAPATYGRATLGLYVNSAGGAVFNAASQGWAGGLATDPVVQRITRNVLDRFITGVPLPYDPVTSARLTEDRFNCPHDTMLAVPGWRANGGAATITAQCAYEGAGGIELTGANSINLARPLSPTRASRNHVEARFYLNIDAHQKRGSFPSPVVSLQNLEGTSRTQVALVEVDVVDGRRQVRLARRGPDGSFSATEWIELSAGWHLVEVTWRSPGTLSIQVDGGTPRTIENSHAGQVVNEVVIEYPSAQGAPDGRVCIDAIAVGTDRLGAVAALSARTW